MKGVSCDEPPQAEGCQGCRCYELSLFDQFHTILAWAYTKEPL
jgi:hypothetical protein